jgi:hypothetical protein
MQRSLVEHYIIWVCVLDFVSYDTIQHLSSTLDHTASLEILYNHRMRPVDLMYPIYEQRYV